MSKKEKTTKKSKKSDFETECYGNLRETTEKLICKYQKKGISTELIYSAILSAICWDATMNFEMSPEEFGDIAATIFKEEQAFLAEIEAEIAEEEDEDEDEDEDEEEAPSKEEVKSKEKPLN